MSYPALIKGLLKKEAYPHTCSEIKLLQTHLSWIILTGDYAYKIKKPINLGFQDFTTLEKRKFYCDLEVNLNQKLASDLYIDVVPITGSYDTPIVQTNPDILTNPSIHRTLKSPPIEWAIKMHEFSQQKILSQVLKEEKLTSSHIKQLAHNIARFHEKTATCDTSEAYGTPESIHAPVLENFKEIRTLLNDPKVNGQLDSLQDWANNQYEQHYPLMKVRKSKGFIKACHGDLHLGNIVLLDDKPIIFDCIEFNESFRWTDTMADVAFMTMDLVRYKRPDLANLLLNVYLESSGDYNGLALLRYYQCYRAMVRAKVSLYLLLDAKKQASKSTGQETFALEEIIQQQKALFFEYLELATQYMLPHSVKISMTVGVSGTGKSTLTEQLIQKEPNSIRIRSDVERKRINEKLQAEKKYTQYEKELYSTENTIKTYKKLSDLCSLILDNQYSVILDATFTKAWQRALIVDRAKLHNISYNYIVFDTDEKKITENLANRKLEYNEVSDADIKVVKMQIKDMEPLNTEEALHALDAKKIK